MITGDYQPIDYSWASGETTQSITKTPGTTTTYTVTGSTTGGCAPTTSSITITVNPLPTATISGDATVCQNDAAPTITFTGRNGTAPYTFTYNINGGANQTVTSPSGANPQSATLTNVSTGTAGTFKYNLVSVQGQFCTNPQTGSATVTVNALPTVAANTGTNSVCVGSTTALSNATTGGTWSTSNASVATVNTSGVVTGVAAGTAIISYTITSDKGCTNSATTTVTVKSLPSVAPIIGANSVCEGKTTTLTNATEGGTGTATITYTTAPSNGCTNSATSAVTVKPTPAPLIEAEGPTVSCTGTVKLTSSEASSYQWYRNETAIALATAKEYTAILAGKYSVTVTNAEGCSGTSAPVDVSFITNSWTAAALSSNWNDPLNWCSRQVPTSSTDAVIPSGVAFYPELSVNAEVKSLEVKSGATVSLKDKTLAIYGTLSGPGKFVGSAKSGLTLNGTSSPVTLYFDQTTDAETNVLEDLTINSSATVSLNNKLYIIGTLAPNGSTLNTGDHLTLRSTSIPNTARVAPVSESGTINGDVTVERFIPARRSFRFVSPSVTTTTSIKYNWMENAVNPGVYDINDPKPGYGTNITGKNSTANGFDPTITNNHSLYTFNTSDQKWDSVLNTNGDLKAGDAYRLMVRGSRSTEMWQPDNNPDPSNTILRATGKLFTGTHIPGLTTKVNGYTFIGNPYASPVDFEEMIKMNSSFEVTGTANNIKPEYTVWDPQLPTRGVYVTYNAVTHANNFVDPVLTSKVDKKIQSGQAFFVQTIGSNPKIEFNETYKTTGNTAVFRDPSALTKLSVQLLLNADGGMQNTADGVAAFFDDNFKSTIGNEDSYKFTNLDENLAINRKGASLSIEGRPSVTADDTIPLKMWRFRQNSYYLKLTASNFSPEVTAFVKDAYLHKETPVDLSSVTLFPFTIDTALPASFANDRLSIVFKAATALPVTMTNVKAYQKDEGIQVNWTAEAEMNIERYEVEKSVDGQNFEKATGVTAKGNNAAAQNYSWFDENANTGSNFYRIKVIEKSGAIKYTQVVKVNIAWGNSSLTVFPNPIKGNLIKVQLNNMEKGRYSAVLYNTLGQRLYSSIIEHTGRSATYTISLGRLISKGTYTLHINKGDTTINERVIVE